MKTHHHNNINETKIIKWPLKAGDDTNLLKKEYPFLIFKLTTMRKIQSLDSMLLKTLEASEMRAVNGGYAAEGPSKTATEAGITVYSNGNPATVDSPSNPNDGCDDNCTP